PRYPTSTLFPYTTLFRSQAPNADPFRSDAGAPTITATGKYQVVVTFPAAIAAPERLFDTVAILSARSPLAEKAVLGPFVIDEYRSEEHTSELQSRFDLVC